MASKKQRTMDPEPQPRVFVYPLSYDTGIAPNVAGSRLTLACCMPAIREQAVVGDWIVGTGSERHDKALAKQGNPNKSANKILYVGMVEEVLPWHEYSARVHLYPDWAAKRCSWGGDCIYKWEESHVVAYRNPHLNGRWDDTQALVDAFIEDTSAPVLVCDSFYYLGDTCFRETDMNGIETLREHYMGDNLIRASPGAKTRTAFQVFPLTDDIDEGLGELVTRYHPMGKPCLGPYDIDLSEEKRIGFHVDIDI
jgi:hypothetical protein